MIKEAIVALLIIFIFITFWYQFEIKLSDSEYDSCRFLCEENGLIFKGGANFQDNKGIGCKACYCEKQIPLECGD